MPKGSALSNGGTMFIEVGKRISISELKAIGDLSDQAKSLRCNYKEQIIRIHKLVSTVDELIPIVHERYIYKGRAIEVAARKTLKAFRKYATSIQGIKNTNPCMVIDCAGMGELAIMLGLMYPEREIYCNIKSIDFREVLEGCIQDFARNVKIINDEDAQNINLATMNTFIVTDSGNIYSEITPGAEIILI